MNDIVLLTFGLINHVGVSFWGKNKYSVINPEALQGKGVLP